jgi:CRISPR-associated protein Cas6
VSDGGDPMDPAEAVVDVAFPLAGEQLPRDHAVALAQALGAHLPWLASDPIAGVHPVKVVVGNGPSALLSRRARLLLRLVRSREPALAALAGCTLMVEGHALRLGTPKARSLLPHGTLYAYFVAAAADDEQAFVAAMAAELRSVGIDCHIVCGKRQQHLGPQGQRIHGFSLMLHGLSPADSLRIQRLGLGAHRTLGCGIFVPHRSAAAVAA